MSRSDPAILSARHFLAWIDEQEWGPSYNPDTLFMKYLRESTPWGLRWTVRQINASRVSRMYRVHSVPYWFDLVIYSPPYYMADLSSRVISTIHTLEGHAP